MMVTSLFFFTSTDHLLQWKALNHHLQVLLNSILLPNSDFSCCRVVKARKKS